MSPGLGIVSLRRSIIRSKSRYTRGFPTRLSYDTIYTKKLQSRKPIIRQITKRAKTGVPYKPKYVFS